MLWRMKRHGLRHPFLGFFPVLRISLEHSSNLLSFVFRYVSFGLIFSLNSSTAADHPWFALSNNQKVDSR